MPTTGAPVSRPMRVRGVAALLVMGVALAGCGAVPAAEPGGPCAATAGQVGDICPQALTLAEASLGIHAPTTSVGFRTSMCPPNARCAAPAAGQGWVIFTFVVGPPRMVYVGPPDPVDDQARPLVARGPEPLPDWLLEEMGLDQD